jgi:hypothetical protein
MLIAVASINAVDIISADGWNLTDGDVPATGDESAEVRVASRLAVESVDDDMNVAELGAPEGKGFGNVRTVSAVSPGTRQAPAPLDRDQRLHSHQCQ